MKTEEWYASDNDEYFQAGPYESKELAIEAAIGDMDLQPGQSYWVGKAKTFEPTIDAESLMERFNEEAYEDCGEHVDDWPSPTKEALEELSLSLNACLDIWLDKYKLRPNFFVIEASTEHVAPEKEEAKDGE